MHKYANTSENISGIDIHFYEVIMKFDVNNWRNYKNNYSDVKKSALESLFDKEINKKIEEK